MNATRTQGPPTKQEALDNVLGVIDLTREALRTAENAARRGHTAEAFRALDLASESAQLGMKATNIQHQIIHHFNRTTPTIADGSRQEPVRASIPSP